MRTRIFALTLLLTAAASSAPPPPPASAIAALRAAVSGAVLTAADGEAFEERLDIDNQRCVTVPYLFVLPLNAADVGQAMGFARNWSLPFAVKSGGHSAACYS